MDNTKDKPTCAVNGCFRIGNQGAICGYISVGDASECHAPASWECEHKIPVKQVEGANVKELNRNKWIGKFRLFFNNCPACNSDAPEIDDCIVCNNGEIRYADDKENAKRLHRFLCWIEMTSTKR